MLDALLLSTQESLGWEIRDPQGSHQTELNQDQDWAGPTQGATGTEGIGVRGCLGHRKGLRGQGGRVRNEEATTPG